MPTLPSADPRLAHGVRPWSELAPALVEVAAGRALRGGESLSLTSREFDLLVWFLQHPGVVHSREDLIREVWRWNVGDPSTVTVHVRRLREKIETDPSHPTRLATVFGKGYRWDATDTAVSP